MIRSTAAKKSSFSICVLLWRAAINAASLQTLAMSAPEKPGVCFAKKSKSTSGPSLRLRTWTPKMPLRSFKLGSSTWIWRSKRPARSRALSRMSARLVAAMMMTPALVPKPSISVSNWFSVLSRSSLAFENAPLPRARPMASISSMKMMQGAFSLALRKRSRTREAPTPTNISTKSEPDMEKNGTFASPATALANRVLPVPGGPTSSTPLGILPPKTVYFWGFFRKSTTSSISNFAPSRPATSLNVTNCPVFSSNSCARDLPMLKMLLPPPAPPKGPPPLRIERIQKK